MAVAPVSYSFAPVIASSKHLPHGGCPNRDWLRRFMIDRNEQGKGCGQAALQEIGFTMQG